MALRLADDLDQQMPSALWMLWDAAGLMLSNGNATHPLGTAQDRAALEHLLSETEKFLPAARPDWLVGLRGLICALLRREP